MDTYLDHSRRLWWPANVKPLLQTMLGQRTPRIAFAPLRQKPDGPHDHKSVSQANFPIGRLCSGGPHSNNRNIGDHS